MWNLQNRNVDPMEAFFNGGSGYVEVKKDIQATPEMERKQGQKALDVTRCQTAEANINAGIAAAKQINAFFKDGCTKFQVNK